MNGGGGDVITLEDLESVSEEQLSDGPEEEQEQEEEQQGRLLQYWRDVARGHQVEVPTGTNTTTAERLKTQPPHERHRARSFAPV